MIFPFPNAKLAVHILRYVTPLDYPNSHPIYVLPESAMEEFLQPFIRHLPVTTTAFTSPSLDQDLSRILSLAGCWRGSGFAVVYRDKFFESLYGDDEGRHFREGLSTLLHEAAHNLDFRSFTVGERIHYESQSQKDRHGERWARAVLHMHGLPAAEACRRALAGELGPRKHDSILKILADDPPRSFSDLMEGLCSAAG